jgi:drug/metabolite transporter (DMT)-like permease
VVFAVGFGVLAAFLFAGAASLQQQAAQRDEYRRTATARAGARTAAFVALIHLVRRLVRSPLWLVGWVTNLIGFLALALALHFGSVALVQPLMVCQLLFALPMALAWRRGWPQWRDWLAAGLVSGGLAVFLAVRDVAPRTDEPDRARLIVAGLATVGAVALLVLASVGRPRLVHATLVAIAAGLCFAFTAVAIKVTSEDLVNRGVAATARDWPGYALAASALGGLVLEQGAFATGSLPSAVAAMNITNPVAGYLLGIFAFSVAVPTAPAPLAALAGAAVLVSVGAVGLANSPIVRADLPDEPAPTAGRVPRVSPSTHTIPVSAEKAPRGAQPPLSAVRPRVR